MSLPPEPYLGQAATSLFAVKTTIHGTPSPAGSRRRRLWEMCGTAQCPVVGICLPMPLVKKLAAKHLQHTESRASNYETHCAVVVACKTKSSFGKLVQEQLDQRFQNEVRAVQSLKTREALWAHWTEHKEASNFPGVFWSVLSHPRCDAAMEFEVLGHAHMLQHQAGCERQTHEQHKTALQEQLKAALAGNKKLEEKYLALQNTHTQTQQRQQETISALQTELASQHGEMQKLQLALSMAKTTPKHSSSDLAAEIEIMRARVSSLKASHQLELSSIHARVKELEALLAKRPTAFAIQPAEASTPACTKPCNKPLENRCVLCVGGRPSAVPLYRQTVETRGATFMHHDGGQEEGIAQLDAKLNSADLVICQAGCVSHEAYFRVKEHCKKRGIQCVYVQNPSKSALRKALQTLAAPA
ncbi:DUF2325 domain-containing protein [Limnobacter alexandrii]|uniref:DUF2325 domain-containing protein n=1 Tax=Limnobacter alexandrii TaxID=2570352 RepID=UPI001109AC2D|nr:DUF2325 domain-containing protein [Limnobacter alexandrii]